MDLIGNRENINFPYAIIETERHFINFDVVRLITDQV